MDECVDLLGGAAVATTWDCNNGYWQVRLPKWAEARPSLYPIPGFPLHLDAVRVEEYPCNLSMSHRHHSTLNQVRVCVGAPERCHHLFRNPDGTLNARSGGTAAISDGRVTQKLAKFTIFETTVFYHDHLIRLSQLKSRQTESVRHRTSHSPEKPNRVAFFSRYVYCVPTVCPRLYQNYGPAEQEDRQRATFLV